MATCKITVLKRTVNRDLIDEYLADPSKMGACNLLRDGQTFLIANLFRMPEGFCEWAWADLRPHIMTLAAGGDLPFIKPRGTLIAGCTDWFRPVIFKIERIE